MRCVRSLGMFLTRHPMHRLGSAVESVKYGSIQSMECWSVSSHRGSAEANPWFRQVETTALAEASAVARMARLVEQATAAQSPIETMVQRFARVYTPLVLIATACVAFVPWIIGKHDHKVCSNPRKSE